MESVGQESSIGDLGVIQIEESPALHPAVTRDAEQVLFNPNSEERKKYEPYDLKAREIRDLGRQKERFQEWRGLSFKEFALRDEFKSPEAVISYFLDHPNVDIKDSLVEILTDNKYQSFIDTHFSGKTKLNPKALASEISDIVAELIILREKIHQRVEEVNLVGSRAIEHHMGYEPPEIGREQLLLLPSVDVYNYIAHGVSTDNLIDAGTGSKGMASYPIVQEDPSAISFRRIAIVPMAFAVNVATTGLRLESSNKMELSESDKGIGWYKQSINTASHETEHARVWGEIDKSTNELKLGFKSLPRRGSRSDRPIEQLQFEKDRDEGMTDFISIWKLKVVDGTIPVEATFDQVIEQVQASITNGSYFREISIVIQDMKEYRDRFNYEDPLKAFLTSYYHSFAYPLRRIA